jgi:hypothetical protein
MESRDGEVVLGFPAAGFYRVSGGKSIEVTPAPGSGDREVRLFLLGSAWGMLCYQRGLLPLHASVVETGGGAVALCGPSGAGKSTLAAALSRLGHGVLGDDLCRADVDETGSARVWPGTPRLKLWREALEAFRWDLAGLERDHFRTEKFHVPIEMKTGPDSVALRSIYLLEWGDERLTPLEGREALRRFVTTATYRGEMLGAPGQVEAHWRRCFDLVRRVPVSLLCRPRDFAAGERIARRLSESLGLAA